MVTGAHTINFPANPSNGDIVRTAPASDWGSLGATFAAIDTATVPNQPAAGIDLVTWIYEQAGNRWLFFIGDQPGLELYGGRLADVATLTGLTFAGLNDGQQYAIDKEMVVWNPVAAEGKYEPDDKPNPGVDQGYWVSISGGTVLAITEDPAPALVGVHYQATYLAPGPFSLPPVAGLLAGDRGSFTNTDPAGTAITITPPPGASINGMAIDRTLQSDHAFGKWEWEFLGSASFRVTKEGVNGSPEIVLHDAEITNGTVINLPAGESFASLAGRYVIKVDGNFSFGGLSLAQPFSADLDPTVVREYSDNANTYRWVIYEYNAGERYHCNIDGTSGSATSMTITTSSADTPNAGRMYFRMKLVPVVRGLAPGTLEPSPLASGSANNNATQAIGTSTVVVLPDPGIPEWTLVGNELECQKAGRYFVLVSFALSAGNSGGITQGFLNRSGSVTGLFADGGTLSVINQSAQKSGGYSVMHGVARFEVGDRLEATAGGSDAAGANVDGRTVTIIEIPDTKAVRVEDAEIIELEGTLTGAGNQIINIGRPVKSVEAWLQFNGYWRIAQEDGNSWRYQWMPDGTVEFITRAGIFNVANMPYRIVALA